MSVQICLAIASPLIVYSISKDITKLSSYVTYNYCQNNSIEECKKTQDLNYFLSLVSGSCVGAITGIVIIDVYNLPDLVAPIFGIIGATSAYMHYYD